MVKEEKKFDSIKKDIYELFHEETDERRYSYVRRDWIFPNHLDIMVELVDEMCEKYKGNKEICKIAVLLHDVGLVYRRDSADSIEHEERSIEYARKLLEKYGISEEYQKEIIDSIKATDSSEEPSSINAKIVRTADALSQFISVHFFAKAAFSGDWNSYLSWLKKKSLNNFKKICFEDERKMAEPIRNYIKKAIEMYEKYNQNYPLKLNKEKEG